MCDELTVTQIDCYIVTNVGYCETSGQLMTPPAAPWIAQSWSASSFKS